MFPPKSGAMMFPGGKPIKAVEAVLILTKTLGILIAYISPIPSGLLLGYYAGFFSDYLSLHWALGRSIVLVGLVGGIGAVGYFWFELIPNLAKKYMPLVYWWWVIEK